MKQPEKNRYMKLLSHKISTWKIVLLLGTVFIASAWGTREYYFSKYEPYSSNKFQFLKSSAKMAQEVETIVIGDSIIESMYFVDGKCGKTFNAGISGSTINDWNKYQEKLLKNISFNNLIVGIGTNDSLRGNDISISYPRFIKSLPSKPKALIGVTGSKDYNFIIQQTALEVGADFIAPVDKENTYDGVHPNSQYLSILRNQIYKSC